ncbi:glycosyltransferase family 117 protein [Thermodesulfovibrio hydrogeniphilus]
MIYIFLLFFCFLYFISSTKVLNSGDAGELVVSSVTLGIAHPSGYPLYLEILKLFSLIPAGNISFRMVFVSILFSVLSLYLIYKIVLKITNDKWASVFSVVLLGFSYSFWGQSVVIKFYPLNLFIITFMLYLGIKIITDGYDRRHQLLISLFLGLALANHHTGFIMVIPFFVLSFFYTRDVFKNLALSLFFLLAGFLVNIHMLIRGQKGFCMNSVTDLNSFLSVFLRKPYKKGASLEIAKNVASTFDGYWYAIKNSLIIIQNNFPVYVFPLFLLGIWYAFKTSKKLGIFLSIYFLAYSVFLAKISFSGSLINMDGWYMGAHQYFLPMLSGFCILAGLGFFFLLKLLRKTSMELLKLVIPSAAILMVGLTVFERLIDQNFNDNYVPYTVTKTILSSLPVGSLYLTFGDNHTFQSWYFKYVAKYREDICSQDYFAPDSNKFIPRGCQPTNIYKNSYIFSKFFKELDEISRQERFYSIIYLENKNPLRKYLKNQYWVFTYMLIPANYKIPESYFEKKLTHWQELEYLSMLDCANYKADDQFTRLLCNYSLPFFAYLARSIEVKKPTSSIKYDTKHDNEFFTINAGIENREILDLYSRVLENNKSERFRYYRYSKEYLEKQK